ncbi:MAG: hypothetical protein ACTHMM_13440 [Agriterribacter sp.]
MKKKIFGIPVLLIVAGIAAYVFRDKLKPLIDKIKSMLSKETSSTTSTTTSATK